MNNQFSTLIRFAIATLLLWRSGSTKGFVESFRAIEREVLRGAPDLPDPDEPRRY